MRLGDLAESIGVKLEGDPECQITGVAPLSAAVPGQVSFYLSHNRRYKDLLPQTKASAVVLKSENLAACPCYALISDHPELSFAKLAAYFDRRKKPSPGIHPSAILGEGCQIDPTASIGPHCTIGDQVRIGRNTVISANTCLGNAVVIGDDSFLFAHVTVYDGVMIGSQVSIHSGVVLGADGFGLAQDQGQWLKIPQLGSLVIGSQVEIGANTTIDRGSLENTVIEEGVKIDNQVHIGHNVRVGAHTAIAGCVGIAGSTCIGKHCMIGGGAGINGHITIADRVIITGMGRVMRSINEPGIYSSGMVLQKNYEWRKSVVYFHRFGHFIRRLKRLERLVDK